MPFACTGVNQLAIKNVDIPDDTFTLSEADRTSYEKVFSSILVPFASLTVGEDIGQGKLKTSTSHVLFNTRLPITVEN